MSSDQHAARPSGGTARDASGDREEDAAGRREPAPEPRLHDMGGDIGPASIRGSGVAPGGQREGQAEPAGGFSEPMGYVAGRDDDWAVTAGSDEKAVAARTDRVGEDGDTFGLTVMFDEVGYKELATSVVLGEQLLSPAGEQAPAGR